MEKTRRGRQLLLSLSFLCLAVLLPGVLLASPAAGRKRRWAGFDHYVLALQWPGTVCRQTNRCCSSNGCCRSNPLNWFTIHGLWPQYSYGGWPSCCRPTTAFNMNKGLGPRPQSAWEHGTGLLVDDCRELYGLRSVEDMLLARGRSGCGR